MWWRPLYIEGFYWKIKNKIQLTILKNPNSAHEAIKLGRNGIVNDRLMRS